MSSHNAALWEHFQNEQRELFVGAEPRLNHLLRLASSYRPNIAMSESSLLNIGCGNGYMEITAKKKGWCVISVDPDEKAMKELQNAGIDARSGYIESLPVESRTISVVIATEVFEHLSADVLAAGFREIHRVLRDGGILLGTVPYRETLQENTVFCPECKKSFHRWGHQQSFDLPTMRSLLAAHFQVAALRVRFFPPWPQLNWKGMLASLPKFFLSRIGIHGSGENLVFMARKEG